MIERLGKDMVVNGDVLPSADYYDGIDETEDGPVIDKIISSINPAPAERYSHSHEQHEATALAQGVLFLIDQGERSKSIRTSLEQHPSAQNVSPQELSVVARGIIAAYQEELQRLEQYKKRVNASVAARRAFIAVIRNLNHLSPYDREEIAVTLGHDKDFFKGHTTQPLADITQPLADITQPRELDWRERQANDDTLKGE